MEAKIAHPLFRNFQKNSQVAKVYAHFTTSLETVILFKQIGPFFRDSGLASLIPE